MNYHQMITRSQSGFSMIELMVVIVIMGIVMAIGIPSFNTWIENGKIRTGTESLSNGINLARTEAIRRNEPVQFRFDPAFKSTWDICAQDTPPVTPPTFATCPVGPSNPLGNNVLHARYDHQGSSNVQIGTASAMGATGAALATGLGAGATSITFDGLGRLVPGVNNTVRVDVVNPKLAAAKMRRLVIQISIGGQIRTCDPDPSLLLSNDPRRCA